MYLGDVHYVKNYFKKLVANGGDSEHEIHLPMNMGPNTMALALYEATEDKANAWGIKPDWDSDKSTSSSKSGH